MSFVRRSRHKQSHNRSTARSLVGLLADPSDTWLEISSVVSLDFLTVHWLEQRSHEVTPAMKSVVYGWAHLLVEKSEYWLVFLMGQQWEPWWDCDSMGLREAVWAYWLEAWSAQK